MLQPSQPDLAAAGITVEQFATGLFEYVGTRHGEVWMVRFRGRFRAIQGMATFTSRESARSAVERWLRDAGRWSTSKLGESGRRLPSKWSYKKSYRDFIVQLRDMFETDGTVEYVCIQAGITPSRPTEGIVG